MVPAWFQVASGPIVWTLLTLTGVVGLIALISPRHFQVLCRHGNRWIDTSQALAKLDTRIEFDEQLLPYSRWLGAAVLASLAVLTFVVARF